MIRLQRLELPQHGFLHGVRALQRQLLHGRGVDLPLHRAVGVPLDHDARGAVLTGEPSDLVDDEIDVRVIQFFTILAVHVGDHLLAQVPRVGIEMDHDRLGEDLVALGLDGARGGRDELHLILVALVRVPRLAAQLLDDREIHHLVEGHLRRHHPDAPIEEVRRIPGALEV